MRFILQYFKILLFSNFVLLLLHLIIIFIFIYVGFVDVRYRVDDHIMLFLYIFIIVTDILYGLELRIFYIGRFCF